MFPIAAPVRADLSRATRALTLESDDLAGRFERLLGPEHPPRWLLGGDRSFFPVECPALGRHMV